MRALRSDARRKRSFGGHTRGKMASMFSGRTGHAALHSPGLPAGALSQRTFGVLSHLLQRFTHPEIYLFYFTEKQASQQQVVCNGMGVRVERDSFC